MATNYFHECPQCGAQISISIPSDAEVEEGSDEIELAWTEWYAHIDRFDNLHAEKHGLK